MITRQRIYLLGVCCAVLASGCSTDPHSAEPGTRPPDEAAAVTIEDRPGEAHLAQFAKRIPGYGGHYFDESGNPHVYLVDRSHAGLARSALTPAIAEYRDSYDARFRSRLARQPSVIVEAGRFTWGQLASWRERLNARVLGIQGVVFTDLDETKNRLTVGISKMGSHNAIVTAIARAAIPAEAVTIELVPALRELQAGCTGPSLTSCKRPLAGGLQVAYRDIGDVIRGCTLGFNARRGGVLGFVTNSHCSQQQSAVDPTAYYQNAVTSSLLVGSESVDPGWVLGPTSSCASGKRCRWSDANFVRYLSGVASSVAMARIYLPRYPAGTGTGVSGSTTISEELHIAQKFTRAQFNLSISKVGLASGWTDGKVSRTCMDTPVTQNATENRVYLCQQEVKGAYAKAGDSGAPVFTFNGDNVATLYGVLRAGYDNGTGYVFSPMDGIERDLGALQVTLP
jgi:hypothetical protein